MITWIDTAPRVARGDGKSEGRARRSCKVAWSTAHADSQLMCSGFIVYQRKVSALRYSRRIRNGDRAYASKNEYSVDRVAHRSRELGECMCYLA
jgi:hypothetical protein